MTSQFYRTQAEKCRDDAANASLVQVRERNMRAAAAWQAMADKLVRTESARSARENKAAAVPPGTDEPNI
ncbi:hypothetical protein [Sphingopyxis sp. MWB1]|uniref:hypothetical protein n=1 Tax=Sphingopyxis sp. MWB1 TaxID=1537715 RepID=UPI001F332F41|nr:hypothetical protein [Sphingopyxis sp. MWB1]